MNFGHPGSDALNSLQTANRIVDALARETGGLLWDEETREVFSPDEWHRVRISLWKERFPKVSDHTTIHAYKKDEYVRAITLGMAKFGLPDVVIEDFSWSANSSIGNLINFFCQSIVEGAVIDRPGEFDLDLRKIMNREVRETQIKSLKSTADVVGLLSIKKGKWEDSDPNNRLIEITFDRYPGKDIHAKQEKMLASLFGWEDGIVYVNHDDELLTASQNAKAKLPAMQEEFIKGLQPGEFIQVKAPFKTPDDGQEWMWVEITAWDGNSIKGLLKNEPFHIPSLHGGQIVEVNQEDIFDYIKEYADGTREGNKTGIIIKKMQAQEIE